MKKGFIIGSLIFLSMILLIYLFTTIRFTGNIIISVENVTGIDHSVKIGDFMYSPYELVIGIEETVRWTNLDVAKHTVTSHGEGPLNSGVLEKEETYSYTFNELGEYYYHCHFHPDMEGKIIVE